MPPNRPGTSRQQRYKAGIGSYLEALTVRQQLLAAERGTAALKAQKVTFPCR